MEYAEIKIAIKADRNYEDITQPQHDEIEAIIAKLEDIVLVQFRHCLRSTKVKMPELSITVDSWE